MHIACTYNVLDFGDFTRWCSNVCPFLGHTSNTELEWNLNTCELDQNCVCWTCYVCGGHTICIGPIMLLMSSPSSDLSLHGLFCPAKITVPRRVPPNIPKPKLHRFCIPCSLEIFWGPHCRRPWCTMWWYYKCGSSMNTSGQFQKQPCQPMHNACTLNVAHFKEFTWWCLCGVPLFSTQMLHRTCAKPNTFKLGQNRRRGVPFVITMTVLT